MPFAGVLSLATGVFAGGVLTVSIFSATFVTLAGTSSAGFAPLLFPRIAAAEVDGFGAAGAFTGVALGDAFDFAAGVSGA